MDDKNGYAVYFFPPALEALGEAVKPYLVEGPGGAHVLCREIDTAGSLIEMTLDGRAGSDQLIQVELMVPTNMVRMIVSARSDEAFGFGPRMAPAGSEEAAPAPPPVGSAGEPADAPPQAVPREATGAEPTATLAKP